MSAGYNEVMLKTATIKTKYGSFRCVFEPEKDMGGYTAEARGVSGAITWGKTLTAAKRLVAEVIEGAIEARAIVNAEAKGLVRVNKSSGKLALAA